jgi:hypothetical protein
MKNLLFTFMLIPVLLSAQTDVPPGPVSGTWDLPGSPYMVNGEIYIHEDSTLVIEPGVEVRFNGWYKFIVNGSLFAEGTDMDKILFTAHDTNNRWHGIQFIQTIKTSVLDQCIVEYGLTDLNGMLPTQENSGGGILFWQSPTASITIMNSTIRYNNALRGGGLHCQTSSPTIENCDIVNNSVIRWGGGIDVYGNNNIVITIKNSNIAYNTSGRSGGGISLSNGANAHIKNNTIVHNIGGTHGGGIRVLGVYDYNIAGNLIAHNLTPGNGGGIQFYESGLQGSLSDNTIAYNTSGDVGGGMWMNTNCAVSFTSDIFYFNIPDQVCIGTLAYFPTFNYCDVQDGCEGISGIGAPYFPCEANFLNCIEADPLFVDPMNNDFNLSWTNYPDTSASMSPCIDKGCPGLFPAPDGTCNDIGAYDYFQVLWPPDTLYSDSITDTGFLAIWSYSNPATGYYLDVAEDAAFSIWVLENYIVEGDTSYFVDGLEMANTYYYRVRAFNPGQISEYSDTMQITIVGLSENKDPDDICIYASRGSLYINSDAKDISGLIWVYNLSGQLLLHQGLAPGNNVIDPVVTNQILIVRVVIDGRMYHRKLFIH